MKRLRRRISHTLQPPRLSSDEGLAELAENLSLKENGDVSRNGNRQLSFLNKSSHPLSFSTSRITDVHSSIPGMVHEHPHIGSDGESEEASGASDDVISPVRLRPKNRRLNQQDISKRLSLPADLRLPESFLAKQSISPILDGPISRSMRRQSLSEIGFGKMETYTKLDKLGEGTYATVFKGKSRLTDNLVALKEIRLEHDEGAPCTAIREVSLLKDLKHNNIVTLHDIVYTDTSLTLVFEYLSLSVWPDTKGLKEEHRRARKYFPTEKDLKQYMEDCRNILNLYNVKLFLVQLLRGLAYCHKRKVLHRDLKPQNLLINDKGELKLADFGLARAKSVPTKTYSNEVVTLWYRPPDVLLGSTDYTTSIDMWGVGCIFFEMASGRPLFPGSSVEDELHFIFRTLGVPNEETWPGITSNEEFLKYKIPKHSSDPILREVLKQLHYPPSRLDSDGLNLLEKLLKYDPKQRIDATDAMKEPYFDSLGPSIHNLPDTASIFTIPGVQLRKNPGNRTSVIPNSGSSRSKRQSMLL